MLQICIFSFTQERLDILTEILIGKFLQVEEEFNGSKLGGNLNKNIIKNIKYGFRYSL